MSGFARGDGAARPVEQQQARAAAVDLEVHVDAVRWRGGHAASLPLRVTLASYCRRHVLGTGGGSEREPTRSHAVADACERVGFLTVVGHGVPDDVIDGAWTTAAAVLRPAARREDAGRHAATRLPLRLLAHAGETLAASLGNGSHPDLKESFAIGPVDPATHTFADPDEEFAWSPNLWPDCAARAAAPRGRRTTGRWPTCPHGCCAPWRSALDLDRATSTR